MFETERESECHECSRTIAEIDLEHLKEFQENITLASEDSCFDPSLLGRSISYSHIVIFYWNIEILKKLKLAISHV